jgi:hypothetical protein
VFLLLINPFAYFLVQGLYCLPLECRVPPAGAGLRGRREILTGSLFAERLAAVSDAGHVEEVLGFVAGGENAAGNTITLARPLLE